MTFGTPRSGCAYTPRPSAYVVIRDADRVAVVRAPAGLFLPGGGVEPGESDEEAVLREALEECGLAVELGAEVGRASEFVYAEAEAAGYLKTCRFFEASVIQVAEGAERDHELVWLTVAEAQAELAHESHRWAVAQALPTH